MQWRKIEEKLDKKFKPTRETKRAIPTYLEWWNDWKMFGMPVEGGHTAQDVEWMDAIRIVEIAHNKAQREAEEEAQRNANSGKRKQL